MDDALPRALHYLANSKRLNERGEFEPDESSALLDEVSRLREALADALRVARYESDVAEQAIQAMQSSPSIAPTGKPVDE
jgi:hypothetical protein